MSFTTIHESKASTSRSRSSTTTTATIRFAEPSAPVRTLPTLKRNLQPIWSWTFKAEAIAECSVKDALEMTENKLESFDFFWLGRVPCRTLKMLGIVVGVQVYEKKVVYTVDDGTGVIDCEHIAKHAVQAHNDIVSRYVMPAPAEPPRMPEPKAAIGDFVKVLGRLRPSFETRKLITHTVEKCYASDELSHIRKVRNLHATYYDIEEEWVLPPPPTPVPVTPKRVKQETRTPAPASASASIPNPSTGKSSIASSVSSSPVLPVIRQPIPQATPRKLRHPSRLHTQDLTDATFRIYLKHYMDNAPTPSSPKEENDDKEDSDPECPPSSQPDQWATPRPKSKSQVASHSHTTPSRSNQSASTEPPIQGFTLSYLRRVPELALLATRVVQAHSRRKQREERQKLKESGQLLSKSHSSTKELPPDKAAPKMKRLFQWAINQLYKDGSIVLWDGPVRRIPSSSSSSSGSVLLDLSTLWKANTTSSNSTMTSSSSRSMLADINSSMFSSTTNQSIIDRTLHGIAVSGDTGDLSDPSPREESYISVTPAYLSQYVESAVRDLVDRNASVGKPYAGVGAEEVVSVMKRDDRWRYLGIWSVEDALRRLEGEDKVWLTTDGRWDVTVS